ncbi:response regulator transcription factor [Amycolatopsis japonica]|uniref:response regulator transcription factor n=1 Tax=Amycolatopsis japonica TaxID=208439 RepID=UPI0033EDECDE
MVEEVPPVRIVIAEDQAAVREGLALLVGTVAGITVVGQAPDGEVAVRLAGELSPDVVLMDLSMPRCDGVEATRRIKEQHPEIEVVVLTTYADDDWVLRALEAGALGYLTKSANKHEIGRAVHAAAAGQALLDPRVQRRVLGAALAPASAPPPEDDAKLTKREAHVLTLIAAGRSNKEIAAELFVSETTVKSHINRIFAKTGSRDRAQAVRYAYQAGYVRD